MSLDHLPTAPAGTGLSAGMIHVWALDLEPGAASVAEMRALLSEEERQRAARLVFEVHRDRFTVGRGALRSILAEYTRVAAEELSFTYGEQGKPALAGFEDLHFNLSHSGGLGLLGVTRAGRLGVDVERVREADDLLRLAERFFSREEHRRLSGLAADQQPEGFFNAWTRKEAFIKAVGRGISLGLGTFDVSLVPGEPARFLTFRDAAWRLDRWHLFDLRPAPDFAAAVALEGDAGEVALWRWGGGRSSA